VTLVGPQGSGKTALIAAAAEMARDRGFEVLGAAPVRGQPGRLVWAQLLHDAGATEEDSRELLDRGDLLAASAALRALTAGRRRLIVIDDIDTGGHDAVEVLALVASRVVVSSTAVLAAAGTPLGVGRDLKLAGLAEAELGQVIGGRPALTTAAELIRLGRASGDEDRERDGLFWRFVALMELARVDEAEVTLAAFERAAGAAGDAEGSVVALSRHAMLAVLRGRFDTAAALAEEFTARARRIGLPDAERLTTALHGGMLTERGSEPAWEAGLEQVYLVASRFPGHFYEATAARILAALGRHAEAAAELDRLLPPVLARFGSTLAGSRHRLVRGGGRGKRPCRGGTAVRGAAAVRGRPGRLGRREFRQRPRVILSRPAGHGTRPGRSRGSSLRRRHRHGRTDWRTARPRVRTGGARRSAGVARW
jgi:hypothetical protein